MRSTGARIGVLALLAVAAVALFLILGGDDDGGGESSDSQQATATRPAAEPQEPSIETIRLSGGAPVGGVRRLEFDQGDRVRFRVVPEPGVEEIHVHGYEVEQEVSGTKPVTVSFPGDISGGFEVEAHTHDGEFQIAELRVNP